MYASPGLIRAEIVNYVRQEAHFALHYSFSCHRQFKICKTKPTRSVSSFVSLNFLYFLILSFESLFLSRFHISRLLSSNLHIPPFLHLFFHSFPHSVSPNPFLPPNTFLSNSYIHQLPFISPRHLSTSLSNNIYCSPLFLFSLLCLPYLPFPQNVLLFLLISPPLFPNIYSSHLPVFLLPPLGSHMSNIFSSISYIVLFVSLFSALLFLHSSHIPLYVSFSLLISLFPSYLPNFSTCLSFSYPFHISLLLFLHIICTVDLSFSPIFPPQFLTSSFPYSPSYLSLLS